MTGFDGRTFEFKGTAGNYYSIVSERHHKLSAKLKVGVMWDHNGTYMEGYGFQYKDQTIIMELNADDELAGELSSYSASYPALWNVQHKWCLAPCMANISLLHVLAMVQGLGRHVLDCDCT